MRKDLSEVFEVGRSYEILWLEEEGEAVSTFEVIAWESPLLKCRQLGAPETIFNTGSRAFVRATLSAPAADEDDPGFGDLRIDRSYR